MSDISALFIASTSYFVRQEVGLMLSICGSHSHDIKVFNIPAFLQLPMFFIEDIFLCRVIYLQLGRWTYVINGMISRPTLIVDGNCYCNCTNTGN